MILRYSYLARFTIQELRSIFLFATDYNNTVKIEIDFKDNEIELFDKDGYLIANRHFNEIL